MGCKSAIFFIIMLHFQETLTKLRKKEKPTKTSDVEFVLCHIVIILLF